MWSFQRLVDKKKKEETKEFDSSTLEVVGGLLVIVFEAFRQTPETAA